MGNPLEAVYTLIDHLQVEIGGDCDVHVGVNDLGIEIVVYWLQLPKTLKYRRIISIADMKHGYPHCLAFAVREIKKSYAEKIRELEMSNHEPT